MRPILLKGHERTITGVRRTSRSFRSRVPTLAVSHSTTNGSWTRSRSRRVRRAAVEVPAAQLLIETDAPFMSTSDGSLRAGRPSDILDVINALAELRGVRARDLADLTYDNAMTLFT